jgi:hypothetical protein
MEVKVIKFERHLEMQKVGVTFSVKKVDTGFASTFGGLVDMTGTDDEMVSKALEIIQPDIKYWLTTEKNVVGKTFTISIPEPEPEQTVEVPVTNTEEQTVEVPLSSTDQIDS